jgi:carboxymethylenebutenolidase
MARLWIPSAIALLLAANAAAEVRVDTTSWTNPKDNTQVPAYVFHDPAQKRGDGTLPAVLFLHARRGIQDADKKYLAEIAGNGFLVLAPDWQTARFIAPMPIAHDPATELDAALGLDHLRTLPLARAGEKRVLYGYSRGGYYAVKIAAGTLDAAHPGQVACLVTISGHFQDPNAPEPLQAYGTMPELDRLTQPILMIVAGAEPGLRIENNTRAFHSLVDRGHPVEFILLPQARRTFDFRAHVDGMSATAAETTSKRYSMRRVAQFMRGCVERSN